MIIGYREFNFTMTDYEELLQTLTETGHLTRESLPILKKLYITINGNSEHDDSFGQLGYALNDYAYREYDRMRGDERDEALCALCEHCCNIDGECHGFENAVAATRNRPMNEFALWHCKLSTDSALNTGNFKLSTDNHLKSIIEKNINRKVAKQLF